MVWNEETIRHLRDLWVAGHSTAEIGRRLGVSKNSIVGKAHRLDLDARPSPIRREVVKPPADRTDVYPRTIGTTLPPLPSAIVPASSVPPVLSNVQPLRQMPVAAGDFVVPTVNKPAPERTAVPAGRQVSPMQTRRPASSCCWPIGEPGTKSFRFCDDMSLHGKPYCEDHAKLAYVKLRDRKDDAA